MNLRNIRSYNPVSAARRFIVVLITILLPALIYPQTGQQMNIYYFGIGGETGSPDTVRILNYIRDTLLLGGGKLSSPAFKGAPNGIGLFKTGSDIGFPDGMILSNGHVMTSVMDNGSNKSGAQAIPTMDSLATYNGGPPGPPGNKDVDMDYMVGTIVGDMKPDTAVDPTVITFKFKPYYNSIHLTYAFASEEYKYQLNPLEPPPPPPPAIDVDFTGQKASDFMAILVKRYPSEMGVNNIASLIGRDGTPSWVPVSVKYLNHTAPPGYYIPNYDKSFIFDGSTLPMDIRPFSVYPEEIHPCQTYWIKIGVADYPNDSVIQGHNLSYQLNSAVFLKAFGLMSGYGLEWTVEAAVDNNDFASDSSLVEGGCSNLNFVIKFNVMPRDTMFIRMKIGNASLSEYTVTPPLVQDSLIMVPDSVMEWPITISAIDDGINEGVNGVEDWFVRYQMDPCDIPTADTGGFGQSTAGYSGLIPVHTRDYNPYINVTKTYGPVPSNIYHCGNDITVTITDVLQGGIPPVEYVWSHPVVPQIGIGDQFTTPIKDSPDYVYCTVTDRCSGKPGYLAGKDTVIILSQLDVQASSDFQLCQNGSSEIKVQSTNVGRDFTTIWYFQGNPVGYDSIYNVTWAEYGSYAPNTISFTCEVTDECGNTNSDQVNATFFPVVEITGVPLICLGETIQLVCSGAQSYQWHYGSLGGPVLGGNTQVLNYTPTSAGMKTICVSIINDCGEQADTCFTFEVSELVCEMVLDNSATDFNVCPNVPFTLKELHAYDGWQWSWNDNGPHTDAGQTINLSLSVAGPHTVQVIAYNINGCYDTITRTVTVFPYSGVQAFTDLSSVCIDYPAQLSATTGPVSVTNYYWTANPPDASLAGQQNSASPIVTPQVTTTYECKIKDNNGCYDSTTVVVNVRARIAGTIMASPGNSCTDKPVQINFQPIVNPLPGASYYWTFDDGVPATSTSSVPPSVIWGTPGSKTIQLTISEPGCEETFNSSFTVFPDPLALFSASSNTGCQPVEASFSNASSNLENPSYLWDFGDGTTGTEANPSHVYPNPGHYNVTLTVTNATGCVNTLTVNDIVEVYEVPIASFSADPQAATIDNPTIKFTDESSLPWSTIDWNFGDGGTANQDGTPRHTYNAPGSYTVIMYTETVNGCWDRDTLEVGIMEDIKIFVPNAFTPNGDGLNDCFSVGGTTGDIIDQFHVIIYSRWGELVYESQITNPECVWDGKDLSGVLVPGDTYIFRIYGQNFRGAKKVYEGMVTIVR
jgi:gliding motility-associated-like protein